MRACVYLPLCPLPRSLFRSIDLGGVTAVTRFEIPRSFTTRRGVSLTIARRRLISRGPRLRARRIAQQASKRNCDCNDPCPRTIKGRRYQRPGREIASSPSAASSRALGEISIPPLPFSLLLLAVARANPPRCVRSSVRPFVASPDRHARGESANYDD